MPPVLERTSSEHMRGLIDKIKSELKTNGMPFIATPEKFAFDDDLFHDTQYHLNLRGIPLRMQEVVEALNLAILQKPIYHTFFLSILAVEAAKMV